MFRKLRLARSFKFTPRRTGCRSGFERLVAHTARAHQYGLTDFVGRTEAGNAVCTKYARRTLLRFAPEDLDLIADTVLAMLEE